MSGASSAGTSSGNTKTSKALSYFLRHGGKEKGVDLDTEGWVALQSLLKLPKFKNVKVAEIEQIVANCPKQRFSLEDRDGTLFIRANQGHSIASVNLNLEKLSADTLPDAIIHGTYHKFWESIKKEGLCRMTRNHIHFAAGLPGTEGVISGMRSSCQLLIYVDASAAIQDGFEFWKSDNNVILCSGNEEGYLPTRYFAKVVDLKTGKNLLDD